MYAGGRYMASRKKMRMSRIEKLILKLMDDLNIDTFPSDEQIIEYDHRLYMTIANFHGGRKIVAGFLGIPCISGKDKSIFLLCKKCSALHQLNHYSIDMIMEGVIDEEVICQEYSYLDGRGSRIFNSDIISECDSHTYFYLGSKFEDIDHSIISNLNKKQNFIYSFMENKYSSDELSPVPPNFNIGACNFWDIKTVEFGKNKYIFHLGENIFLWFWKNTYTIGKLKPAFENKNIKIIYVYMELKKSGRLDEGGKITYGELWNDEKEQKNRLTIIKRLEVLLEWLKR